MFQRRVLLATLCALMMAPLASPNLATESSEFTPQDIAFLKTFTLSTLPPLPAAPDNRYADHPAAAAMGEKIFFDPAFSANGEISCASCHQPERFFTDGRKLGVGLGTTRRNTPSLLGASYGPWRYWDGRKDSLWSQAIEPLLSPNEHGLSRKLAVATVRADYEAEYEALFGAPVKESDGTLVLVNVGKALQAYQRSLRLPQSRFDNFVKRLNEGKPHDFSAAETRGMRLFMGKAGCVSCHNGPLFTNFEFHNVGVPEEDVKNVDLGRYEGIDTLRADPFNCLGKWSDAGEGDCAELEFLKQQGQELVGAFKTPSLRNVGDTAPYMHAGQFSSLTEVIAHYNKPKPPVYFRDQHPFRPHFDILPLGMNDEELKDLEFFLRTLSP